ncbi:MAG TPA: hypothetical protein DDZ89_13935 [Clostridiales bacterium]|nr:hypothetical protein [Clostridiales bacterium]
MDIIRKYVEALLAEFPQTDSLLVYKDNLLLEMNMKLKKFLEQGKTEKEAVGFVIAEYGDITERYKLIQHEAVERTPALRTMYKQEAEEYLLTKKNAAWMISIGVVLCILGVAALVSLNMTPADALRFLGAIDRGVIGLVLLLTFIAFAVGLFIYSGVRMEKYEILEGKFILENGYETEIKEQSDRYEKTYIITLITGVVLCILSPLILIIPNSIEETPNGAELLVFFIIIAIAVFLLSFFGIIRDGYRYLLRIGEYSEELQQVKRGTGVFVAIIWPLAAIIFLLAGFLWQKWNIAWIVFVIAGILNGMIKSVYSNMKGGNKDA